jgi:predicted nucleic acid-binding protein
LSVYADASFLVSLYVHDAHSANAAVHLQNATPPILLNPLGEIELANAISQMVFRKEFTTAQAKATHAVVRKDIESGLLQIRALGATVFDRAMTLTQRRTPQLGTRTLDILHVACALDLRAEKFLTFDQKQARLAKAEGLIVAGLA